MSEQAVDINTMEDRRRSYRALINLLDFLVHWSVVFGACFLLLYAGTWYIPSDEQHRLELGPLDSATVNLSTFAFKAVQVSVKSRSFGNITVGVMSRAQRKALRTQVSGSVSEAVAFGNGANSSHQVSPPIFIRGRLGRLDLRAAFNDAIQMSVLAGYRNLSKWLQRGLPPNATTNSLAVFVATGSNISATINITQSSFYYIVWSGAAGSGAGDAFAGSSTARYSYWYQQLPANMSSLCTVNSTCTFVIGPGSDNVLINSGPLTGNSTDVLCVTYVANTSTYALTIVLPMLLVSFLVACCSWFVHDSCRPFGNCAERQQPANLHFPEVEEQEESSGDELETELSSLLAKVKGTTLSLVTVAQRKQ